MSKRSPNPMSREEISRLGGKAVHKRGTAHQWTPEEARAAGRKGGKAKHRNQKSRSET